MKKIISQTDTFIDFLTLLLILIFFVILISFSTALIRSIKFVKEYERIVVFRLGRIMRSRGPGITYVIPFIEKGFTIDIRTKTLDIPKQEVMTIDNVPVSVNAICFYKVVDPERAVIIVQNYHNSIYQLAQATTRSVVGESHLDEVLSKRDKLNQRIKDMIEKMVDDWGLHVDSVEIKDVELPDSMKRSMARQAEAERDRRGRIIQAEGEKIAAEQFAVASKLLHGHPEGLHLRTLQALQEIGAEKNQTTIMMIPVELLKAFQSVPSLLELLDKKMD
ncbi:MAG: SPFH domain-containing protein [Candidatus Hodarchaeales archaeon]